LILPILPFISLPLAMTISPITQRIALVVKHQHH